LLAESQSAGAVLIESYVRAIAELAAVLDGDTAPLSEPVQGGCLEEVAIRTDTAALRAELLGEDPLDRWQRARDRWQQLGYTVWLARAQARTGDTSGAGHTLDVLDSPAEARAWALGGTTN
jgi:hypothetical protein